MHRSLGTALCFLALPSLGSSADADNSAMQDMSGNSESKHLRGLQNGQPLQQASVEVVNANVADKGRYPYYVKLVTQQGAFLCGGALIAPDVVFTSGRCDSDLLDSVQTAAYEQIKIEQSYHDPAIVGQMLLKLETPSTVPHIQNINFDPNVPALDATNTMVLTMGRDKIARDSNIRLQDIQVTYGDQKKCAEAGNAQAVLQDDQICTTYQVDGLCLEGFLGSPLISAGTSATADQLIGSVVWAVACDIFPMVSTCTSASTFIKAKACQISAQKPAYLCNST